MHEHHTVECSYAYRQMRAITISVCYLNSHKSVIFSEQKTLYLYGRGAAMIDSTVWGAAIWSSGYDTTKLEWPYKITDKNLLQHSSLYATIQQNHIYVNVHALRHIVLEITTPYDDEAVWAMAIMHIYAVHAR